MGSNGNRVAVVAGLRTPFAKQWSAYREVSALDLANIVVVRDAAARRPRPATRVQQVVYGQVVPVGRRRQTSRARSCSRPACRSSIEAYSVSRACATSYQSTVNVAEAIMTGAIDTGVAGGADSASNVPITVTKRLGRSAHGSHEGPKRR